MESRHCGQDKIIFFCPVHNASTPCSLQAFGIRCIEVCSQQERVDVRYKQEPSRCELTQYLPNVMPC